MRHGNGVLNAGVAVDDHVHVVLEQCPTLRHHHHVGLARGLEDLLALVAARLVVAFDGIGTGGFHAFQMGERIIQIVHFRRDVGLGSIQNRAGGKNSRTGHNPAALHFSHGKNSGGVIGGIVDGGDAKRERGVIDPALLWHQPLRAHAAVPMHINQAGNDGFAARVNKGGTRRRGDVGGTADGGDAVAADDYASVVDDLVTFHGDNARTGNDRGGDRFVRGLGEADLEAVFGKFRLV